MGKSLLDLVILEVLCYVLADGDSSYMYFVVFTAMVLAVVFNIIFVNGRLTYQWTGLWVGAQVVGVVFSAGLFLLVGPKFLDFLSRDAQGATLVVYQTLLFVSRATPFKAFAFMQFVLWLALFVQNYFSAQAAIVDARTCIIDSWINCIYAFSLVIVAHNQEMNYRKSYN